MTKIRIVFNRYSIDAMCATSMIVTAYKNSNNQVDIETIPYSHVSYNSPTDTQKYQKTFMIGVTPDMQDILKEIENTDKFFFINSGENIKGIDVYQKSKGSAIVVMPDFMNGKQISDIDESYSTNLSKLTRVLLGSIYDDVIVGETSISCTYLCYLNGEASELDDVIKAVESFTNLKQISTQDIAIVHKNYDPLIQSAFSATAMVYSGFNSIGDQLITTSKENHYIFKENTTRILKARNFIHNGMTGQLFGDRKSSMLVQTIQIVEEYLYDVIRLASYSHDAVVTYQDTKHNRQWWVYCTDKTKAEKIINSIPFLKATKDGVLTHLISEIPRMTK